MFKSTRLLFVLRIPNFLANFVSLSLFFMDRVYIDILSQWEDRVANPAIYERLDTLFPSFKFRRVNQGGSKDHWASRYKLDLSLPRYRVAEKTVVYRSDLRFREQGDWDNGISVIDMYVRDRGLTNIYEGYKEISREIGLAMPQPGDKAVVEATDKRARQATLLDTLIDYFCWNLENNKSAKAAATRTYLKKKRGFTMEDASRLCLGFVPDWDKVIRYITIEKHFPKEDLNEVCGVVNAENYTSVGKTHILSIPYECGGVVKGFLFRRIDDTKEGPKYLANADLDRKSVFFNIKADCDPKEIIVVEGEMDALKATSEGIDGVVAIGGSEIVGNRRNQIEDAFRRGVRKITLCLDLDTKKDSDDANFEARHSHIMKSVHTIKDVDPDFEEIYIASFKTPSDPDQFIREKGPEAFKKLLADAVPYWDYLFSYMKSIH